MGVTVLRGRNRETLIWRDECHSPRSLNIGVLRAQRMIYACSNLRRRTMEVSGILPVNVASRKSKRCIRQNRRYMSEISATLKRDHGEDIGFFRWMLPSEYFGITLRCAYERSKAPHNLDYRHNVVRVSDPNPPFDQGLIAIPWEKWTRNDKGR